MAKSFASIFIVGTVTALGSVWMVSGFCHGMAGLSNQAQYTRIHVSWSSVVDKADVSADKVLVTTRWIFLVPQDSGLITHDLFWAMSLWVAKTIIPAYDSGLALDAKDASEKAMNLRSSGAIGFILIVTSWCFFAVWRVLLAIIRVVMVALLIWDCNWLSALDRSGRVWTAAYCKDPISPLSRCLSSSVTAASSCARRSGFSEIGLMFFT